MRLFHFKGEKSSKFVTQTEVKAVKLAKHNETKKTEISYTDVFIQKIKAMIKTSGSDKKIIEDFIKKLTNDK